MIAKLLLFTALSCPEVKMVNKTTKPWNDYDRKVLTLSKKRCKILFSRFPCVLEFHKTDEQEYKIICGRQVK